jgi:iron(III) transport system permease protein
LGGLLNAKRITLSASAALLIGVGFLPLAVMLASSVWVRGGFSARNYVEVFGNPQFWILFRNSLTLAALTTSLAGIAGVILGVLIIKTDMPVGTLLAAGFSLPLLFPPYILAVGWFEILGRGGILSRWTNPAIGEMTSRWLFGFPGAVVVLASVFMPIVLLLTITYLRSVSPTLEEAAQLSYSPFAVLRQMTIPLIRPGIVLALTLVFLLTMGECGAPAFLRLNVFPVASFTQLSAFYNFGAATAAATPLIGVLLAGLLVEQKALGQRSYSFRWVRPEMTALIPLGRKRIPALVAAITLASLFVGIPMAGVLWRGSSGATLSEAITRGANSAVRSVLYAAAAATLISALGFFLAYSVHRRAIAGWRWLDGLGLFLFTLPGTIIGIGLISLWNRSFTNWIYATPALLVFGFMAQYTALGTRILAAGMSQLSPSLEEAAEVAGVKWFHRVFGILAPLLRRATLAVWIATFVFCLRCQPSIVACTARPRYTHGANHDTDGQRLTGTDRRIVLVIGDSGARPRRGGRHRVAI